MPNAKDAEGTSHLTFLLVGGPGDGKTTQYRTLPGRGFIYMFDPNSLASLEGMDVEYEVFSPDLLDINVKPLSSKVKADSIIRAQEPLAYARWEEHFDEMLDSGRLEEYDWIGFDSYTSFGDMVMDRVMWLNGRMGKQPEQDDWAAQMATVQNVSRTIASRGKMLIATAHEEMKKDLLSGRINYQIYVTGRLRIRIPLLFSNIYQCYNDKGVYHLFTVNGDGRHYIRSSIRDIEADIDITIPKEGWADPTRYGLGKILRDAGRIAAPARPAKSGKKK